MQLEDVKLGIVVKSPVSGLEGHVTGINYFYDHAPQVSIQPVGDGKTMPDSWNMDAFTLEKVSDGLSASLPEVVDLNTVELGSKVKDPVTGMIGIATAKQVQMNGCVRYVLTPPMNAKGELPKLISIDQKRAIVLAGPEALEAQKPAPAEAPQARVESHGRGPAASRAEKPRLTP